VPEKKHNKINHFFAGPALPTLFCKKARQQDLPSGAFLRLSPVSTAASDCQASSARKKKLFVKRTGHIKPSPVKSPLRKFTEILEIYAQFAANSQHICPQ
jgi:hypothetical protein